MVQNVLLSEKFLPRLLDKDFIQKGEFSGNSEAVDILRSLLKGAGVEKAGISIGKVYGKDVLLVTVPAETTVPQTAAPKTLPTCSPIKTASGPGELAASRGFLYARKRRKLRLNRRPAGQNDNMHKTKPGSLAG